MRTILSILMPTLIVAGVSIASAQTLADVVSGCGGVPPQQTIAANPSNYQSLLSGLAPGDRLLLAAGVYPNGLSLDGIDGTPNNLYRHRGTVN